MPTLYPFQWGKKAHSSEAKPQEEAENSAEQNHLEELVNPAVSKYYPALLNTLHACLSVCVTNSLKGKTKPLSLILETPSGYGKTAVLQMFFPAAIKNPTATKATTPLDVHIYRSDKFTPKSFVTHAANVKKADLEKIDLLPKLRDKTLITKELAPLFRGRETEMQENFSILISILDGKGFTSDSGSQGTRGYKGPINFNWLGATTPFSAKTHRMMSQLGTRFLFYEVPVSEPTAEELLLYAKKNEAGAAEVECNLAVNKFLLDFFKKHPIGSIDPDSISFPDDLLRRLIKWAMFLTKARSEVKYDKTFNEWEPVAALRSEGPWKVIGYFKELAMGRALIQGRREVNEPDLELVMHVAVSSVPGHLRNVIKQLRLNDSLTSTLGEKLCAVSRPTIRKYFRELEILGIVELKEGDDFADTPHTVTLTSEYQWLRE
jgi:hypothetical protein